MSIELWWNSPKHIYIRVDEQWWQPWANTIAYYPLETDYNDHSWNHRDPIQIWSSVSLTTSSDGYKCANFIKDANSYINYGNQWNSIDVYQTWCTIAFWLWDVVSNTISWIASNGIIQWDNWTYGFKIFVWARENQTNTWCIWVSDDIVWIGAISNTNLYWVNSMHMYTFTLTSLWSYALYKDKNTTPIWTATATPNQRNRFSQCYLWYDTYDSDLVRHLVWNMRQVILENKVWTQDDINKCYDTFVGIS